jgi:anti-sigma factor RsiW
MTIKHHIADDLVLAYASGELDEATSLLVATHMALCPQCRQALELAESIGGTLIEEEAENPQLRHPFRNADGAAPTCSRNRCAITPTVTSTASVGAASAAAFGICRSIPARRARRRGCSTFQPVPRCPITAIVG